jgi:hypothetical protein
VLFQHPNSWIAYKLYIPPDAILDFSLTLSPETWQLDKGDGVQFDIYIENDSKSLNIFSTYIDPKNIPSDRSWHNYEINLSTWAGETVTITFNTGCGPSNDCRYDWAGWGEPRILIPISYNFLTELPDADLHRADKKLVRRDTLTINDEARAILFQHPTSQVIYSVTLPKRARLYFGLGMDPAVWSKSDGVEYNIYLQKPEEPDVLYRVFHRYLDPNNNPDDRDWLDQEVNLSDYDGQTVDIIFEALPGLAGDTNYDWGGWSNPVLVTVQP